MKDEFICEPLPTSLSWWRKSSSTNPYCSVKEWNRRGWGRMSSSMKIYQHHQVVEGRVHSWIRANLVELVMDEFIREPLLTLSSWWRKSSFMNQCCSVKERDGKEIPSFGPRKDILILKLALTLWKLVCKLWPHDKKQVGHSNNYESFHLTKLTKFLTWYAKNSSTTSKIERVVMIKVRQRIQKETKIPLTVCKEVYKNGMTNS